MDIDAQVASFSRGPGQGAEPVQSVQAVLDHPGVDVVAVCSPHQFHAEAGRCDLRIRQARHSLREAAGDQAGKKPRASPPLSRLPGFP